MLAKNTFQRTKIAVDDLTLIQKIMQLLKNIQEEKKLKTRTTRVNFFEWN